MPTQEPPRLWFELNSGSDPIAGQMHADGKPPRSFHSWLELVALIEEMHAGRSEPTPTGRNDENKLIEPGAPGPERGGMKDKLTRRTGRSALALVGALAVLGIGSVPLPTVAAAAAPAGRADADYRPSEWAPASDAASSGKAPSLTNHVGMPESDSASELWLGYGLIGASLLVLACGLAGRATQRRGVAGPARSPASSSSAA